MHTMRQSGRTTKLMLNGIKHSITTGDKVIFYVHGPSLLYMNDLYCYLLRKLNINPDHINMVILSTPREARDSNGVEIMFDHYQERPITYRGRIAFFN